MAADIVDPADLAKGSTDLRHVLTQNRVPDKFQATLFLPPEASLSNRALAAAFVVAWRAAQARTREQADREGCSEMREWAKPIPHTDYMAMRQAFCQEIRRARG